MDVEFKNTAKKIADCSPSKDFSPPALLARRIATPLSVETFLDLSEWVARERKKLGMTQIAASAKFQIPVRRLKTYEAIARWPTEAKVIVRSNSASFTVTALTRLFVDRSWKSKETLLNALKRHIEGKPQRRTSSVTKREVSKDPNILALEYRLKSALHTRVSVVSQGNVGEIRICYLNLDELDRLLDILERIEP